MTKEPNVLWFPLWGEVTMTLFFDKQNLVARVVLV